MATTQIQPPDEISKNLRITVYRKWHWTDAWTHAPHWQPVNAVKSAGPAFGSASFRLLYGSGKWEDEIELTDGTELETCIYCYVQIRGLYGKNEFILWTGIIPAESFRLLGKSANLGAAAADQLIEAISLDALLENRLDGGWVLPVGGGDCVWLDELPTFNQRYEYGGTVIGNRSEERKTVQREGWVDSIESYVFADEGRTWGNYDVAEYLLQNYQPYNGPRFLLNTFEKSGSVKDSLNQLAGVYDFHSTVTVRQALDMLISRSRGFSWRCDVDADDNVVIVPFTLVDEPISLGSSVIPANPNRVELDLWGQKEQVVVDVVQDVQPTYDRIIVRGAKIKCCCSLRNIDNSLEKAWTDEEEKAFQDAAKDTAGYADLNDTEKGELNDKYRSTDKFSRVYTTLRVPRTWNWQVGGGHFVNPLRSTDGLIHPTEQGNYWNTGKRLLPFLPFIVGYDYSGEEPVNNNDTDSEPEFRKLFAVVENRLEDQYRYVEKCEPAPGTVRPLSREMGVEIKFNPQYLLARGNWSVDSEPAKWANEEILSYGFDWKKVIATVFIESDQYNQIVYNVNRRHENKRILTIEIPDAELWYVAPGTIVDIDPEGKLVEFNDAGDPSRRILRDDRDRLRAATVAAVAWYGRPHNKIIINIQGIDAGAPLGTILVGGDVTGIGAAASAVTSVRWLFDNGQTIVSTDFAPLNVAGMFGGTQRASSGGGTVSTPIGIVSSKKIETLEKKVALLLKEVSLHALRQEPESLKPVYVVREAIAKEDSPDDVKIKCNLLDDSGREIIYGKEGEETNVDIYCKILADEGTTLKNCTPDIKSGDSLLITKLPWWNEETQKSGFRWYCIYWFERDTLCGCPAFGE